MQYGYYDFTDDYFNTSDLNESNELVLLRLSEQIEESEEQIREISRELEALSRTLDGIREKLNEIEAGI